VARTQQRAEALGTAEPTAAAAPMEAAETVARRRAAVAEMGQAAARRGAEPLRAPA
jgi:hypothetical protein